MSRAGADSRFGRGRYLLAGCLAGSILLAALGGDAARLALRYERAAILAGEYWRLLSGHLVHLGWPHSLLNLAGLTLVGVLFAADRRPAQWLAVALASAAAIDVGFLLVQPQLVWYVGFSGVLHGLFAAGALGRMFAAQADGYLLGLLLLLKLGWEQLLGPLPFTEAAAGGEVVEQAHLYGAIGGALSTVALVVRGRKTKL